MDDSKYLGIDIGGTRIKGALIPKAMTLEALKQVRVEWISTLGWMNKSLSSITDGHHESSLLHKLRADSAVDHIFISGPFGVADDRKHILPDDYYVKSFGVEVDFALKAARNLGEYVGVTMINDALAWAMGVRQFARVSGIKYEYPVMIFSLGTAVAVSRINDDHSCELFNMCSVNDFWNLTNAGGNEVTEGWQVHGIIGYQFFDWIKGNRKEWDYRTICNEMTKRFQGLIDDFMSNNYFNMRNVRTVLVCGGNSNYILTSTLNQGNSGLVFSTIGSEKYGVNDSVIPLIGL